MTSAVGACREGSAYRQILMWEKVQWQKEVIPLSSRRGERGECDLEGSGTRVQDNIPPAGTVNASSYLFLI